MTLTDGRTVEADSSGFVVMEFLDDALRPQEGRCATSFGADAVYATLGKDGPPIFITGCSPSYLWVAPEFPSSPPEAATLLFETTGSEWRRIATVDFGITNKDERCRVVPDYPAPAGGPTARQYCLLLG